MSSRIRSDHDLALEIAAILSGLAREVGIDPAEATRGYSTDPIGMALGLARAIARLPNGITQRRTRWTG